MKTLLLASLFLHQTLRMHTPTDITCNEAAECVTAVQAEGQNAYLFPGFVKGVVYFRNGTKQTAVVNYHRLSGQMQFLNTRTDTLLFTGKYLIHYIEVGQRRFLLTEKHADMEVIGGTGRVLLAAKVQPEPAGNKLSHSGQHFSASEGNAAHALMVSNNGGNFQWENNASGHRWQVKTTYFLVDRNSVVHPASRRAFMAVYARNRRPLTRYLRDHRIDFNNAEDLQKLLIFCDGLTSL